MSLLSEAVVAILDWTGWLATGWRWAFSPAFRERKRRAWRDLPAPLVVLDAFAAFTFWLGEIVMIAWLI